MAIQTLTPTLVSQSVPQRSVYIIRDRKLKGFHLRITPKGCRRFVLQTTRKGIRHYETIGDADRMSLDEARMMARRKIDALSLMTDPSPVLAENLAADTVFETVAEITISRRARRWKPGTIRVNQDYLKNQIMPFFGGRPVASITPSDVAAWYAGLGHIHEAANRSVPVLSAIMREAETLGLRPRDSNPALGLHRYRRRVCSKP